LDGLRKVLREREIPVKELHKLLSDKGYDVCYKTLLKMVKEPRANVETAHLYAISDALGVATQELF